MTEGFARMTTLYTECPANDDGPHAFIVGAHGDAGGYRCSRCLAYVARADADDFHQQAGGQMTRRA